MDSSRSITLADMRGRVFSQGSFVLPFVFMRGFMSRNVAQSKVIGISSKKRRSQREQEDHVVPDDRVPRARVVRRNTRPLEAQTQAQGQLISAIMTHDVVFISGPAGTGKTYIAASMACEELQAGRIDTLFITRPMQACGEDMGFLPGELEEKYAPWVAPVMDVIEERLGKSFAECLLKNGRIQWQPLQYMRGKSLKNAWLILDEAQNTTVEQMKMLLTRIGEGSKFIINGDVNQSDLKGYRGQTVESGLYDAVWRLRDVPEIAHVEFTADDIVRHGIIRKILERY